jgi:hypothetical protein
MSSRRVSRQGLALGIALSSAGIALAVFAYFHAIDDTSTARPIGPASPEVPALGRAPSSDDLGGVDAESAAKAELASLETLDHSRGRKLGWIPPPRDTLAAVRGRVVDEHTREPLAGMTLTFLSRRPKTARVVTGDEGQFETGVDLASGVVAVLHVADASVPKYAARWDLEPAEFFLPLQTEGATPFEVVLSAKRPESVLEVDVKMPDGTPAAGATVSLVGGRRDERGDFVPDARLYEVSDPLGRTRFALFGADVYERSYVIEAEHRGTLASDPLELDPPIGMRPKTLDLQPGGIVRVHAQNDEGRPLSGVSLWLSTNEGGRFVSGRNGDTDASGDCVFTALRAACYSVSAVHPLTGRALAREVDLPRGGRADVEFRLTLSGLRLGAAGMVLDETGAPLSGVSLRMQTPGEDPLDLETSPDGLFEFWSRPVAGIHLSIGGGFLDDRFEPEDLSVPFGTTHLTIRRLERLETETRAFQIFDDRDHGTPPRATIFMYHAESASGSVPQGLQRWSTTRGLAQVSYKRRDDTFYAVEAPGYLRAHGKLSDLIEACGPVPLPLHVELVRGFERHLEVRDRVSKRIVAGARFSAANGLSGTSDSDGAVSLSSSEWPAVVRIECTGYEPLAWNPADAGFPGTVVWLEPLRAAR